MGICNGFEDVKSDKWSGNSNNDPKFLFLMFLFFVHIDTLSPNPALGASGAVFGIMAGLQVFLARNGWVMGEQGEAYSSAITQTFLINLFMGAVNPMV